MIAGAPIEPGLFRIELRRPDKRNALGVADYRRLADLLDEADRRPDVRAVVLSGEGGVFCAGNDLAEFVTEWPQPPDGPVMAFLSALHRLDKPLLAAVEGAAVGIGATMLLHCDIVVAAPDAFLLYPFVDRGIAPEAASSLLLPGRIGAARAAEILLTGRRVPAAEALDLGLISRVDPAPLAAILGLASIIAAKDPAAVRTTRRLLRDGDRVAVAARFATEIAAINALLLARRG